MLASVNMKEYLVLFLSIFSVFISFAHNAWTPLRKVIRCLIFMYLTSLHSFSMSAPMLSPQESEWPSSYVSYLCKITSELSFATHPSALINQQDWAVHTKFVHFVKSISWNQISLSTSRFYLFLYALKKSVASRPLQSSITDAWLLFLQAEL